MDQKIGLPVMGMQIEGHLSISGNYIQKLKKPIVKVGIVPVPESVHCHWHIGVNLLGWLEFLGLFATIEC